MRNIQYFKWSRSREKGVKAVMREQHDHLTPGELRNAERELGRIRFAQRRIIADHMRERKNG